MNLVNIGFSNLINSDRIVSIMSPESAPIKRVVQEAKSTNNLIDASSGRKTKSVIVMDSYHVILSSLQVEILQNRINELYKEEK